MTVPYCIQGISPIAKMAIAILIFIKIEIAIAIVAMRLPIFQAIFLLTGDKVLREKQNTYQGAFDPGTITAEDIYTVCFKILEKFIIRLIASKIA